MTSPEPDPHDRADGAFAVAFGAAPSALTWTCAGPAAEYALRSALCGDLGAVDWPSLGDEWAFIGLRSGRVVMHRDAFAQATAAVRARRRSLLRRAARLRRASSTTAQHDAVVVTGLREGRLRSVLAERTSGDLLMTSNRLRELLFRTWSHHAATAAAVALDPHHEGGTPDDPQALAAAFDLPQPLPLWRPDDAAVSTAKPDGADLRRPHADNVRATAVEIHAIVDELARRCVVAGALTDEAAVADLLWDELPDCVAGRLTADAIAERVAGRVSVGDAAVRSGASES